MSEESLPNRPPIVFISHAHEDKEKFVLEFAERLRADRIDAWLDKWEIAPGDSLVEHIFEEGIGKADAIVIVLSEVSVTKPWVREELSAAVVRKINDRCRLIPIVLGQVSVPTALRHLRWLHVDELGIKGVVEEIIQTLYDAREKPPLGVPPSFLTETRIFNATGNAIDDTVLDLVMTELRPRPLNLVMGTGYIERLATAKGIGSEAFRESFEALASNGIIQARAFLDGVSWQILGISPSVWLSAEAALGVDVDDLKLRILAYGVNNGLGHIMEPESAFGVPIRTVEAALMALQTEGCVQFSVGANGEIWLGSVTALGKRALRR